MTEPKTCEVPSCSLPRGRRWCSLHAAVFAHHGAPAEHEERTDD